MSTHRRPAARAETPARRRAVPERGRGGRVATPAVPAAAGGARHRACSAIGAMAGPSVVGNGWTGGDGPDRERITLAALPADAPEQGLVYDGLTPAGRDSLCAGAYELDDRDLHARPGRGAGRAAGAPRRHPGDRRSARAGRTRARVGAVPPDAEIVRDEGGSALTAGKPALVPDAAPGDADFVMGNARRGLRGRRAHRQAGPGASTCTSSARPSRYADFLGSIRVWSAGVDAIFDASAAETGGSRHIRFVTTPSCRVDVAEVQVPEDALSTFRQHHRRAADARLQPHRPQVPDLRRRQRVLRDRHLHRRHSGRAGQPQQRRPVVRPGGLRLLELRDGRAPADPHARRGAAGLAQLHRRRRLHRRLRPALRRGPRRHAGPQRCARRSTRTAWTAATTTTSAPTRSRAATWRSNWNVAQSEFLLRGDGGDDVPDVPGATVPAAQPAPRRRAGHDRRRDRAAGHAGPGAGGDRRRRVGRRRRRGRRRSAAAAPAAAGQPSRRPTRPRAPSCRPAAAGRRTPASGTPTARQPVAAAPVQAVLEVREPTSTVGPADLERRRARRPATRSRSTACRSPPRRPPGPG